MRAIELREESRDADFRISLARRSSAFSRFSALVCSILVRLRPHRHADGGQTPGRRRQAR
jgi:hypothetical protein